MSRMIFVNLPVADLPRARGFYEGLGFTINEKFSNEKAACVVVSEKIYLMVLTRGSFGGFCAPPVGDPAKATSALVVRAGWQWMRWQRRRWRMVAARCDRLKTLGSCISAALPIPMAMCLNRSGWTRRLQLAERMERVTGIEPVSLAWKAKVLPLHNTRAVPTDSTPQRQAQAIRCGVWAISCPAF